MKTTLGGGPGPSSSRRSGSLPPGGPRDLRGYPHLVADDDLGFPTGSKDERELLLQWLGYMRGAVLRNLDGVDYSGARWTPDGQLIPLLGIVHHLTLVEWRWNSSGTESPPTSKAGASSTY